MTQQELFALMERFDKSGIGELRYRQGEEELLLCKAVVATPSTTATPAVAAPAPLLTTPPTAPPVPKPSGRVVTAPLVGTYYASPSPDAPPFVTVGKAVKQGETVALLEAMKMINEVPAPWDGIVEELLAENGALVGFGDPLLRIREG